jgi:hypothetical protein
MSEQNFVFVVHKWETDDGTHHMHWGKNGHVTDTIYCKTWKEAYDLANKKAKELGIPTFQIDTPKHPHVFVKVDSKKGHSD